ncbi:MAG: hypothetical protein BWK80_11135 [Desulfobacteraceae bacterium IS3]|nr:MAG: hypothetical protein BWK80_11135 [Desulfobacteraceae bacterium IS3]
MTSSNKIKVLIVDDAVFMRNAVAGILEADPDITIADSAKNGVEALEKIRQLRPDVVTLDIDMPVMDGLTTLRHIMIRCPVPIVVLSSLFNDGAITFEALRLGVMDFVPKPSGAVSLDIDKAKQQIIDRVKLACGMNLENMRRVRLSKKWDAKKRLESLYRFYPLEYIVVIGTTLAGPNTVIRLLSTLSPTIPAAIVVLQEISPKIIASYIKEFNEYVPWGIEEAADSIVVEQGMCYIGSDEHSIRIESNKKGEICLRVGDAAKHPLNLLFSSAADVFHQNTVGILLSGIGDDGAEGFARIKEASGVTLAKDVRCCVFPNLTDNAIREGVVDMVLDDGKLSDTIESVMEVRNDK